MFKLDHAENLSMKLFSFGLLLIICAMTVHPAYGIDLDEYPAAVQLIDELSSSEGLDRAWVEAIVRDAVFQEEIIAAITRPAEKFPWSRYRPIFVTEGGAEKGVQFWNHHSEILERAEKTFGVDAAVIVAIIGVETRYGKITGRHRVIDSLLTLTLGYPRRSDFFRKEFVEFLKLSEEEGLNPFSTKGSYAGAMGIPQFISSSYRNFAVDFNESGSRNLLEDPADAIGSVANYLKRHGWELGAPIFAELRADESMSIDQFTTSGLKPDRVYKELQSAGISSDSQFPQDENQKVGVVKLETAPDTFIFRAGFPNFYVITTYNRSPLYAMAVSELAALITKTRNR